MVDRIVFPFDTGTKDNQEWPESHAMIVCFELKKELKIFISSQAINVENYFVLQF